MTLGRTLLGAFAMLAATAHGQAASPSALDADSAHGASASKDDVASQAERLMRAGDAAGAFRLLAPLEQQRAGEPRFDYLLGISAIDAGHVSRAIFALERLVATQPGNSLAHAELARAYLAAGETAAARQELTVARQGTLPGDAAVAIDRVLGAIEVPAEGRKRIVRGYLDLAIGHDSNLNSATANGQFALPAFGGIVFTLDPMSVKRDAAFLALGAGVDVQVPLTGPWSLVGSVNGRRTFNGSDHDLQQRQADGSIGVAWSRDADSVSASLQTSTFWLDTNRYRDANGVSAQWLHALGNASQMSVFSQWSRLGYPGQDDRNADRSVLGAGYARAFGGDAPGRDASAPAAPRTVVYGSVYGASEAVRATGFDNFGHHAWGARGGAEYRVGSATWFASLQYEQRRYGAPEPFFDTTRHDRQTDLALGVHIVPAPQWRLTPQVTYTRSASNVTLYDYRRTVLQILLRREFN